MTLVLCTSTPLLGFVVAHRAESTPARPGSQRPEPRALPSCAQLLASQTKRTFFQENTVSSTFGSLGPVINSLLPQPPSPKLLFLLDLISSCLPMTSTRLSSPRRAISLNSHHL